ncbi:sugar phosphate isomerase/epimerase [Bordetella sp. 15P40C-2]|uniref:sugar phosphate isomerase/epimerase family protein n=1 Tax=Bordetella sp. 15P40C-2 TaxID=2572246 RepID=UPI001320BF08|nr:sugar phosphate isomerase/epimerase [Bordetella sp. 15P40C-2]MVW72357.1 TIM barrel protein [Bordetella sp. 15P40C-2]
MTYAESNVITDRPIVSLAGLTLPALPPALLVSAAAQAGYDAVGVNLTQLWRTVSGDPRWFAAEVDSLADALSQHGLRLTHGGHLLMGALDRHGVGHIMNAMRQLDAEHLVLVAAPQRDSSQIEADFVFVCEQMDDIPVLVEFAPYTGWKSLDDAMAFIERHPTVELGLVVDVLHLVRSGSLDRWLARDAWPVGLVQICDAPLRSPQPDALQMEARGNRLDVGEGSLPLAEIFRALPRHVPIEVEAPCLALRNLTPVARAERSLRHLEIFLRSQGYRTRVVPS